MVHAADDATHYAIPELHPTLVPRLPATGPREEDTAKALLPGCRMKLADRPNELERLQKLAAAAPKRRQDLYFGKFSSIIKGPKAGNDKGKPLHKHADAAVHEEE